MRAPQLLQSLTEKRRGIEAAGREDFLLGIYTVPRPSVAVDVSCGCENSRPWVRNDIPVSKDPFEQFWEEPVVKKGSDLIIVRYI